eukprot:365518-Chlamydomonas_euryale.AAC.4
MKARARTWLPDGVLIVFLQSWPKPASPRCPQTPPLPTHTLQGRPQHRRGRKSAGEAERSAPSRFAASFLPKTPPWASAAPTNTAK